MTEPAIIQLVWHNLLLQQAPGKVAVYRDCSGPSSLIDTDVAGAGTLFSLFFFPMLFLSKSSVFFLKCESIYGPESAGKSYLRERVSELLSEWLSE